MASNAVAEINVSRDDARKQKQMQEARAAGTAAPERDAATGKMINPHNPQFITQAPWYLNQNLPSLKHHQAWNQKELGSRSWYQRGTKGDIKTKFLPGACENCGATTHSKKDCMERPRAKGAKWTGKSLMPDEHIEAIDLDYEGKRDRWNGFQPDDYKEMVCDFYDLVEKERRAQRDIENEERAKQREKFKAEKKLLKKKRKQRRRQLRKLEEGKPPDEGSDTGDSETGNDSDTDSDTDSDSEASDDENYGDKLKDFAKTLNATSNKADDKLRSTTRNLRIREDTAKYLLNLDVNSAFYDPKSRSMRQDPLAHLKDEEKGSFRGDNSMRNTGDARKHLEMEVFCWEAYKSGAKAHEMAQPTQTKKLFDLFEGRKEALDLEKKTELLKKYGGENHSNPPVDLLYGQQDDYVEYARDGRVIKGRERAFAKSMYEEDYHPGNHTSAWGSWYDARCDKWGYSCCRSTLPSAYCVPFGGQPPADTAVLQEAKQARSRSPVGRKQKS